MNRSLVYALAIFLALPLIAFAAEPIEPAAEVPNPPFNRLSDYDEVVGFLKGYAAAFPEWTKLESIGKSLEGRDIWLLTLHNPETGAALDKPAMYVDGNIHANEVQGTEATIYTIGFLLENYGRLDRITELMDRATFYFVPMVNPDGRARWFAGPSTANFPRTVMKPVDDDRDGRLDEDGFDDLDRNGVITFMRKRVPMGEGTHRQHAKDPRLLVEVEDDELGDWIQLGWEGIDNDGDGSVNEDQVGYVDPNRTWGYGWQPPYVQGGAGLYPLSIPETRSIAEWALGRPNIAAVQSFHNSGQMILRGPGSKLDPRYPREDLEVYDLIAEEGERMLPGYDYLITWEDLYTVYGSTTEHFYRLHGAIAFTNELYEPPTDLDGDGDTSDEEEMSFSDLLTLGRQFVDWTEVEHPQYGTVEVGGFRPDVGRVPEGFLLEEEMHRNSAFVLFHAHHLPKLRFGEPQVERLEKGLYRLHVPITNGRAIPSMSAWARQQKIHRPDVAIVEGARVVASGLVDNAWLDRVSLQEHRPERLLVPGVGGLSTRTLFFLVEGQGGVTVRYESLKGGELEMEVELR